MAHYLIQTRRSQPISEDPDSENSSSPNEGPNISILEEDDGPDDDKDDKIEVGEEEEVHLLVNKHVSEFSNRQPKDEIDHGMEDREIMHEVEDKDAVICGYNNHDDDNGSRKEKEDQGN